MNARSNALEPLQQLCVVRERQIRIQAVDDVELGEGLVRALAQLVPGLFERHRVCLGHTWLESRERAEQTTRLADVGRFEPQVVVEIGARAMTLFALTVRQ